MTTDKTGAQVTITAKSQLYTVAVEGKAVGRLAYSDREGQRVFYHTVIDPEFGGRGLATILVEEALHAAQESGKRIVSMCSMVNTVLKKHPEYDGIIDPLTTEVRSWTPPNTNPS